MSENMNTRLVRVLVALGVGLASGWLLHELHARFALDTDDAYITYRYARNIAGGQGFVYNPGERVLGTTTPLYTLMLAAAGRAGIEIPRASGLLNCIFGACTVALIFAWLARLTGRISFGLAGAALFLCLSRVLLFTISGMETSLYLFLILATFWVYEAGWLAVAAFLSGLTVLVRMDGAAVGVALLGHYLIKHRRLPRWPVVAAYLVPVLPWFGFAFYYFGNVLPQSMLAKHQHVMVAHRFWMLEFCGSYQTLALWPLMAVGVWWAVRRNPPADGLPALAMWLALYIAAYTKFRIDLYLWYLTPLMVPMALLSVFGLYHLVVSVEGGQPQTTGVRAAEVLVLLAALGPFMGMRWDEIKREYTGGVRWSQTVEQSRADAAAYINRASRPGDVICTGAIGIVGWDTNARLCDVMGLVSRGTVNQPVKATLEQTQARWYISEIEGESGGAAEVKGYEFVKGFNRGSMPVTFLLYERQGASTEGIATAPIGVFKTGSGLTIECHQLNDTRMKLRVIAGSAQAKDYKFFVHVLPPGDPGAMPVQICDFTAATPTSRMTPGAPYEYTALFKEKLPAGGALVKVGLFDESDPKFTRLLDASGNDALILRYPLPAATQPR